MRWLAAIGCCLPLMLSLGSQPPVAGQKLDQTRYAAEPEGLRDKFAASDSLPGADAVIIIRERALTEAAQQLIGLEVTLANGALLRLSSVTTELKPAAALVRLGAQVSPPANGSAALNLRLTGRLGSAERRGGRLQLPFQLTEVALGSGEQQSRLLRSLLSDWLSPERWNLALPPLEIPLELSELVEIPAARFDVEGAMPMEVTTPAYQIRLDFSVAALVVLEGRVVIALRLASTASAAEEAGALSGKRDESRAPATGASASELAAFENEIARFSRELTGERDVRIRLRRRLINSLLEQVAAARTTDLTVRLKPARLRAEEVDGLVRVLNYTDLESGDGRADLRRMIIERIEGGKIGLRLAAEGDLEARLRGREYGIPYRISPRGSFAIRDEVVPLEVVSEGDRVLLRALAGSPLPIEVRLKLNLAGHSLGLSRTITVEADRWLNHLVLPALLRREVPLPRKLALGSGTEMRVVSSEMRRYALSKVRVKTDGDAIDIDADLAIGPN